MNFLVLCRYTSFPVAGSESKRPSGYSSSKALSCSLLEKRSVPWTKYMIVSHSLFESDIQMLIPGDVSHTYLQFSGGIQRWIHQIWALVWNDSSLTTPHFFRPGCKLGILDRWGMTIALNLDLIATLENQVLVILDPCLRAIMLPLYGNFIRGRSSWVRDRRNSIDILILPPSDFTFKSIIPMFWINCAFCCCPTPIRFVLPAVLGCGWSCLLCCCS